MMTGINVGVHRYNTRRSGKDRVSVGDDSGLENDTSSNSSGSTAATCEEEMTTSMSGEPAESRNMQGGEGGDSVSTPEETSGSSHQAQSGDNAGLENKEEAEELGLEESHAKIKKLELHLEVILDENNLLQLELQDVQNSAGVRIAELETQVTSLNHDLAEKENVMKRTTGMLTELQRLTGNGKGVENQLAFEKLEEIYKLFGLPGSDNLHENRQNNDSGLNMNTAHPVEQGSTNVVTIIENCQESTVTVHPKTSAKSRKVIHEKNMLEPAVPLRRSQRKSISVNQEKAELSQEITVIPTGSGISVPEESKAPVDIPPPEELTHLENEKATSPPPSLEKEQPSAEVMTPTSSSEHVPLPVLEPIVEKADIIIHARDTSKENGFHCLCGKSYLTKQKLNLHIRQLTCEWKFICNICEIKFFEAYRLRMHMSDVHGQQITEAHGCYDCGKMFEERRHLFVHQNEAHNCGPFSKKSNKTDDASKQIVTTIKRKRPAINGKSKKPKIVKNKKKSLSKKKKVVLKVKFQKK